MEYYGIPYLENKLIQKSINVDKRYRYYEMKNYTLDFGISTPPELMGFKSVLGWCAKGVDSLADRLELKGFRDDIFNFGEIYDMNNSDILYNSAMLSALISSCAFIYITEDETGYPKLQVIDGKNATGILDETTGLLNEGYAILERDQFGAIVKSAYFTKEYTAYYEGGALVDWRENKAPYALLVPIIYRPDAKRPFGHSRISRACMSIVGGALRTIKRSEISAEFYSFPQKYVQGLDANAEHFEKWSAAMSAMMQFSLNEDGADHVKVGQFTQQSMTPHIEQLKMFASMFAGEVGLTLDDLGFPQSNPSSYDAIRASHENLRLTAKAAQKSFGIGFMNVGYLAACVRDNFKYERNQIRFTKPIWLPPFQADVSMLGGIGDAIQKINTTYPDYLTEDKLLEMTGI